jgi:hypothetical protein
MIATGPVGRMFLQECRNLLSVDRRFGMKVLLQM